MLKIIKNIFHIVHNLYFFTSRYSLIFVSSKGNKGILKRYKIKKATKVVKIYEVLFFKNLKIYVHGIILWSISRAIVYSATYFFYLSNLLKQYYLFH